MGFVKGYVIGVAFQGRAEPHLRPLQVQERIAIDLNLYAPNEEDICDQCSRGFERELGLFDAQCNTTSTVCIEKQCQVGLSRQVLKLYIL